MHQTQLFENLLQIERKSISLLRAHGLQNCQETPIKISEIVTELPEIEEDITSLLARLGFLGVNDGNVVPLTHQIFSEGVESLSCQVLIKFKPSDVATDDMVGSFKWYVSSMMTLKGHLKFETYTENPLQIRYSSASESAAQALKEYVKASEKFGEITQVYIETNMSAQAPVFTP
jgi:hypothetical protein